MTIARRYAFAIFIGSLVATTPARAQISTLCVNCGDQLTQYANFGKLVQQLATQAQQLMTQVGQYTTMLTNLQQLPADVIGGVLAPYKDQVGDLAKLYGATTALYNGANQAQTVIDGTVRGSLTMNMTPSAYLQYVATQAQNRGGVFQQMFNDNNQKLQDLQKTSAAFKAASDNVPNLQGNLDGLAQLNTMAAASGQLATQMLADQKTALSMSLQQAADDENSKAAATQMRQDSAAARATENNALRELFQ